MLTQNHAPRSADEWNFDPATVEDATVADASEIARIYNQSLPVVPPALAPMGLPVSGCNRTAHSSVRTPLDPARCASWIAQHCWSGRPLWVVRSGSRVTGWLSTMGMSERPGFACTAELAVYVETAAQRRGVGRLLVGSAIARAPSFGLDRLMATVWHDNAPSLLLFASLGFESWGRWPGVVWAECQSRDIVVLGRSVGLPAAPQAA